MAVRVRLIFQILSGIFLTCGGRSWVWGVTTRAKYIEDMTLRYQQVSQVIQKTRICPNCGFKSNPRLTAGGSYRLSCRRCGRLEGARSDGRLVVLVLGDQRMELAERSGRTTDAQRTFHGCASVENML